MFCIRRIITSIVCLLLIFTCFSCSKVEDDFLGISKVELTCNLYYEVPRLELYLFSSINYSDIKVKENKLIDEVYSYKRIIKLIENCKEKEGYLHVFHITFEKQEFILQKLLFLIGEKEKEVNIGLYQTLLLEPSTMDIQTSINIYGDNELKGLLTINNKLYNPIYMLEQKKLTINKQQTLKLLDLEKIIVYSDSLKSIDIFSIKPKEKYHQIGGIIQSKFKTNLDEYFIYTSYYYNNMPNLNYLSSVGIDVSSLEVIKNS